MDPATLRQMIRRHNRTCLLKAALFVIGAVLLWPMCYWFFKYVTMAITYPWGVVWSDATYSSIGAACIALLAVEGVHYGRKVFDLESYRESTYYDFVGHGRGEFAITYMTGDMASTAYIWSNLLFCAPRCTVLAWQNLRARTQAADETIESAVELVKELRLRDDWIPAGEFSASPASLHVLDRLNVLWLRVEAGVPEIRLRPEYRSP